MSVIIIVNEIGSHKEPPQEGSHKKDSRNVLIKFCD